jgi:transposase-like protein
MSLDISSRSGKLTTKRADGNADADQERPNQMTTIEVTAASVEVKPHAERRRFTQDQIRRILREHEAAMTAADRGAILRREGLYSSHITRWRQKRDARELQALAPSKRGPKPQPERAEIARLERENARLRKQLDQTHALLELQKKAAAIMDMLTNSSEGH